MTRRMKLILTRPSDDSFEAYVNFRQNTKIKSMHSQKDFIIDDLVTEWEQFWEKLNSKTLKKLKHS